MTKVWVGKYKHFLLYYSVKIFFNKPHWWIFILFFLDLCLLFSWSQQKQLFTIWLTKWNLEQTNSSSNLLFTQNCLRTVIFIPAEFVTYYKRPCQQFKKMIFSNVYCYILMLFVWFNFFVIFSFCLYHFHRLILLKSP